MSSANSHAKRSEKRSTDSGTIASSRSSITSLRCSSVPSYPDRQSIINNTVAFAKATRVFDLPVVLTTVEKRTASAEIFGRRSRRYSPSRRRSSGRP